MEWDDSEDSMEAENETKQEIKNREGFSLECFEYIKQSSHLNQIAKIANRSLYNIREQVSVLSINKEQIKQHTENEAEEVKEHPFISLTV